MSKRRRNGRRFARIGREIGELVERKRAAYGNTFEAAGHALRILFPSGIPAAQMDDALLLARIWDKMQRIATAASAVGPRGNAAHIKDALGESPYRDIAGYGILGAALHEGDGYPTTADADELAAAVAAGSRRNAAHFKGDADAAQVSTVGVRQSGEGEEAQVLLGGVPPQARDAGEIGAPQSLRIEEVPYLPAQPQWSQRWKAEQQAALMPNGWSETTGMPGWCSSCDGVWTPEEFVHYNGRACCPRCGDYVFFASDEVAR